MHTASEIYVSTDVETDGPIPGPFSMLSLGSVAYQQDGLEVGRFLVNLKPLQGAARSPKTMAWWEAHPAQWQAVNHDPQDPDAAMRGYCDWLEALPGVPVFTAYPAGFDFMFVQWYLIRFVNHSPFGHAALDIKSFAMARLGGAFSEQTRSKRLAPFAGAELTHDALQDAVDQAAMFFALRQVE